MPERLTEEQIDVALAHADSYVASGQLTVGQTTALVLMLTTALRQVREALEHANHMRTVYDAENQESLRLLRLRDSEALIRDLIQQRDAAREQVRALKEALPDPDKLLILAAFLDLDDAEHERRGEDVQYDLRKWADAARAALTASEPEEAK